MRFYDIEITGGTGTATSVSYKSLGDDGNPNPAAPQIELDITGFQYAAPAENALVRVWGIPLVGQSGMPGINQASDLNGASITVTAGMSKGLPLANPAQQGILASGTIWQAFGNWIGTAMTLDIIFVAGPGNGTQNDPANLTLSWQQGTQLGDAIKNTLTTAYPGYSVDVNIKPNLVLTEDENDTKQTLYQFNDIVNRVSRSIINDDTYSGVNVTLKDKTFTVFDSSTMSDPTMIDFTDLIGQPTWLGFNQVQATVVMRGDLAVGNYIKFPQTQTTATAAEQQQQAKDKSSFSGTFQIVKLHHVGNSRDPNAGGWVTVIDAINSTADTTAVAAADQPDTEG